MELDSATTNLLRETFGKRFADALVVLSYLIPVTVSRDEGLLEVSGAVRSESSSDKIYGCYITYENIVCGCMDNFARKLICKHILALTLEAYLQELISKFELVSLLVSMRRQQK